MDDMTDIGALVREVRQELAGEPRRRPREALADRPRERLAEQLLDLAPAPGLPAQRGNRSSVASAEESAEERQRRAERARALALGLERLRRFVDDHRALDRDTLIERGLLIDPPVKGSCLLGPEHRSPEGERLLTEARNLLHALLFDDEEAGVCLERVERELLTLTLPRHKAHAIAFVLCTATELSAAGTWRDPGGAADDERAPNTILQVEYGEVAEELVGNGITACLRLINDLEVDEVVLYARMENAEESTLIRPGTSEVVLTRFPGSFATLGVVGQLSVVMGEVQVANLLLPGVGVKVDQLVLTDVEARVAVRTQPRTGDDRRVRPPSGPHGPGSPQRAAGPRCPDRRRTP